MACKVCGKEGNEFCTECLQTRIPKCMIKNKDHVAKETWNKIHNHPYWGISENNPKVKINPEYGEVMRCGDLLFYTETKLLKFSGVLIPIANIRRFWYDSLQKNDGSVVLIATIETRIPELRLTQKVSGTKDADLLRLFGETIEMIIPVFNKDEERRRYLRWVYGQNQGSRSNHKQNTKKKGEQTRISYEEAKTLYMLEEGYTIDDIKKQKRRLLKVFHPDNMEGDTGYTQKIIAAYDVLAEKIS